MKMPKWIKAIDQWFKDGAVIVRNPRTSNEIRHQFPGICLCAIAGFLLWINR